MLKLYLNLHQKDNVKIGIFSGSFDPIHVGHAMVANFLAQYCGFDAVWLMPSPINPLKQGTSPVSEDLRIEMCRIVAGKCSNVKVSDFEFNLPRPSYTWRTLCELRKSFPEHRFSLVIGSDNWLVFDRWRNHEDIIREFEIIIYPRPGYDVSGALPSNVNLLCDAPQALISSTFARQGIREGKNMNYFIDPDVIEFIKVNKLYE